MKNQKWRKIYKKDPKKLWDLHDWKGEENKSLTCPPNLKHSYFNDNIFNSTKTKSNLTLKDISYSISSYNTHNGISDKQLQ